MFNSQFCALFLLIFYVFNIHVIAVTPDSSKIEVGAKPQKSAKELVLAEEVRKLKAAYSSWEKNDTEYRALSKSVKRVKIGDSEKTGDTKTAAQTAKVNQQILGESPEAELRDFAKYVVKLKRAVLEACERVRKLGEDPTIHCVACSKYTVIMIKDETNGGALSELKRVLTRDEKIAYEEARLRKGFTKFDRLIFNHKTEGAAASVVAPSNGNWSKPSGAGATAGGAKNNGAMANASKTSNQNQSKVKNSKDSQLKEGKGNSVKTEQGAGPGVVKKNVPDIKKEKMGNASDDDIIARQLREAAKSETDAGLKEQLWIEYQKYKKSLGS